MFKRFLFSVEGVIGAGKTEFVTLLRERLPVFVKKNVHVIFEPVECWKDSGLLADFYADPQKNSYPFQSITFATRAIDIATQIVDLDENVVIITERSVTADKHIFGEMLHDAGKFTDVEWRAYNVCYAKWQLFLRKMGVHIAGYIVLDPPIDVTMEHIANRARAGETVDIEYQTELHAQQVTKFGEIPKKIDEFSYGVGEVALDGETTPVLYINTTRDFRVSNGGDDEIVEIVAKFVNNSTQ